MPAQETKSRKRDLSFEIPDDVAKRIRWYREKVIPLFGGDPNGDLFIVKGGARKRQDTLSDQITAVISRRVGLHMTPHQFRHLAAALYLENNPEAFQTVSDLLGHSWGKTTLIYAGPSSRRASRAYGELLLEQRDALKLKGGGKRRAA